LQEKPLSMSVVLDRQASQRSHCRSGRSVPRGIPVISTNRAAIGGPGRDSEIVFIRCDDRGAKSVSGVAYEIAVHEVRVGSVSGNVARAVDSEGNREYHIAVRIVERRQEQ
jgi:hypothetical protein